MTGAGAFAPAALPLWLVPHLLSLDAPLVALGWQRWWARTAGTPLTWGHQAILFGAVWAIYLADRLADAARPERADTATARHRFSREHRPGLLALLGTVLATLAVLAPRALTPSDFRAGLTLLGIEAAYFGLVHGNRRVPGGAGWKEAWVGASFAAGCGLFPWWGAAGRLPGGWWLALGGFAVVCALNCALISRWETRGGGPRRGDGGALNTLAAGLALGATLGAVPGGIPVGPVGAGAAGLFLLDRWGARLSAPARRVWADVVLLTPWLWPG